jgi:hypothetical protein
MYSYQLRPHQMYGYYEKPSIPYHKQWAKNG